MSDYELAIRGGTVVTESDQFRADIGIRGGRIAAIGEHLDAAATIAADGLMVLPGGVDSHCHIEQLRPDGSTDEESFTTASASALAGGTTSVVTFAMQFKGHGLRDTLAKYRRRARAAAIDYAFHQIITDPTAAVLAEDIPFVVGQGLRSLKVFLTYDKLRLDDRGLIAVLAAARRAGALVTIHCENDAAIGWRTEALLAAGLTAPKYHAVSRPAVVEREAAYRAIALAELVDQPIQIFHVSCAEVAEEIARAQTRGLKVWAETCPHYLTLTEQDLDRPGFEGAKFMCSPPPRGAGAADGLWDHIRRGTLDVVSSDHAGFSYAGPDGKRAAGEDAPFRDIPNGLPGIGSRLPILWHEGVTKGRITPSQFVRLTAAAPARLFGLTAKGRIAPGADADLVLWDPARRVRITNAVLRHRIDYTPYEGMEVTGWPTMTLRRGEIAMRDGAILAEPGSGRFLPRGPYALIRPRGAVPHGFDPAPPSVPAAPAR